jgi:hypothetical protein
MIDLSKPDLRNVPIGTDVRTTKGFVWELVSRKEDLESWQDKDTGLTWTETDFSGDHHKAMERFPDSLPTKKEFEIAELHGIREIMDMNGKWFWSSSGNPNYSYVAFVFYGSFGAVAYVSRSYVSIVAVCVSGR